MEYFFIYGAGGGAGDWNGLKRTWNNSMPENMKKNVLLKFGDLYFNHASSKNLIKPNIWKNNNKMREWMAESVDDNYILENTKLLLDSGTSKIINYIVTKNHNMNTDQLIREFDKQLIDNKILDKYIDIISVSEIDRAVTIDIPNPFKVRTQSQNTRTNVFSSLDNKKMISKSAEYANILYEKIGNDDRLLTTINGCWTEKDLKSFFNELKYTPSKIAVGGMTKLGNKFENNLIKLLEVICIEDYEEVHFLGCGGIKNTTLLKKYLNTNKQNITKVSVDNSTPWNRAIDGNKKGTTMSGYFDYKSKKLIKISLESKQDIINAHESYKNSLFSDEEMKEILEEILKHQSGNTSYKTYEARAKLAIHNNDVFRVNAL